MNFVDAIAQNLSAAILSVEWTLQAVDEALVDVLGAVCKRERTKLLRDLFAEHATYAPPPHWLADFLRGRKFIQNAARNTSRVAVVLSPPLFTPTERFRALDIPKLATPHDLAVWLGLSDAELAWFADLRRTQAKTQIKTLQHYDYHFIPKTKGPPRLLEAPKSRLKAIQRRILREILDAVPVHAAAHGFVAGRSCVGAASRHAGEALVVAVDLKDFFLTASMARVYALFRSLGYPSAVADALTRLCGASTPQHVFDVLAPEQRHDFETRKRFEQLHLPQGAPTSPALANLVAFRLDLRHAGLARRFDAVYTRYADDLAFSGDDAFARKSRSFLAAVDTIVADEGFTLNARKTRLMRRSGAQRVTGIVVNDHINVPRAHYDQLKAALHGCVTRGPAGENRTGACDFRAHLDGRVAWVETLNPARGAKLRILFERIDWRAR